MCMVNMLHATVSDMQLHQTTYTYSLSDRKNNNYHDRSGANFSARIAALSDNSSRMAKSAELRY